VNKSLTQEGEEGPSVVSVGSPLLRPVGILGIKQNEWKTGTLGSWHMQKVSAKSEPSVMMGIPKVDTVT
jgi:hypothetical protein